MDQGHGDGNIGGWDPNSFMPAGGEWGHHHFDGFDQATAGDNGYPNEFLGSGAISSQISVPGAEYRDFNLFDQGGNVWSNTGHVLPPHGHGQPQPTYAQDPAIHPSFYQEQPQSRQQHSHQHPHQSESNPTVTSRFALDIPQGGDFSSHLHGAGTQEVTHDFSSGVVNAPGPSQNGYAHSQAPISQWQGQMQTGYGASPHQYENPLAASVQQTGSPFPGRGSVPAYQVETAHHQPVNSRQTHLQFAGGTNGQVQQSHLSTAQRPVSIPGSPHVPVQHTAQKPVTQQVAQQGVHQQVPQQVPQHVPQQAPQRVSQPALQQAHRQSAPQIQQQFPQQIPQTQQQVIQPSATQPTFSQQAASQSHPRQLAQSTQSLQPSPHFQQNQVPQQSAPSPQANATAVQTLAKKARAVASASASPLQQAQAEHVQAAPSQPAFYTSNSPPQPINAITFRDKQLLQSAEALNGPKWAGAKYLVFGANPVTLQQTGTPTKRYVTLTAKSGKPPLFPDSNIGWIAAESLGRHLHVYQHAASDLERYQADVRLEIEMSRSGNEVPGDWLKKLQKPENSRRAPAPPEPEKTAIIAREKVRLHPAFVDNAIQIQRVYIEYGSFLSDKARDLLKAMKDEQLSEANEEDLKVQLERAIVEGLNNGHPMVLSKLGGKEKALLPALLVRVLGKLMSNEAASSLSKVILQLFVQFTSMTLKQLELSKMTAIKEKLKKRGDDEVKGLVDQIFKIAEENGGNSNDSSGGNSAQSDSSSKQKEPVKRSSTQSQALTTSKQTPAAATTSDSKKGTAAPSLTRLSKATIDSKQSAAASAGLSKMSSNSEPKKPATKVTQKLSSTMSSSTGIKRSREDDAAGDLRISKKPANENNPPGSAIATGGKPTSSTSVAGKAAGANRPNVAKSTTTATPASSSTAAITKPRSGLLLPGKSRPVVKPVSKSETAAKADVKVAPKADLTVKMQPTKTASQTATSLPAKIAKPKLAEPSKETSATRSAFSALMDEIHQPKKVNTPVVPAKTEPEIDPNETPEQRERRIRKERRRAQNLKVTWRAGDALVEVREFTREPEELAEQGKVFGNVKTDGRNKYNDEASHFRKVNSRMGIKSVEIGDREWEAPVPISFAHMEQPKRQEIYETRGGLKSVESKEQKMIQERESNELMVIYHTLDDVPPTPRSPHYEAAYSSNSPVYEGLPQGTPNSGEIIQRIREVRAWGTHQASRVAQARLEAKERSGILPPSAVVVSDPATWFNPAEAARRDQATLDLLTSDRVRKWADPNPYTPQPRDDAVDNANFVKAMRHIQAVIDSLKVQEQQKAAAQPVEVAIHAQPGMPVPAPVVPQPAAAPAQAAVPDYTAAWAQYYAQQQQQQQAWAGHQQPNAFTQATSPYGQPQQAPQAAQPQQTPEIAALLAQLGNQSAAAQPQHAPVANQDPQVQALLAALSGGASQAQPAASAPADPQNAQYLLDLMKWSQSQGQQAAPAATNPPTTSSYSAPASSTYQSQQANYERYNTSQSYGSSGPSKPAPDYGAMYDDSTYAENYHDNGNNNVNGYNGGRRDRDQDYHGSGGGSGRGGHKKHRKNKGGDKGGSGGGGGGGGNNDDVPDHLRGINRSLIGTKQCAFWAKGTCAKGDKCTFRHD